MVKRAADMPGRLLLLHMGADLGGVPACEDAPQFLRELAPLARAEECADLHRLPVGAQQQGRFLEAYCAPGYHPMADGIALEGMRLIKDALPAAVKDGKDLVARANMMVAASMGATAFQKGLGGMHAISHPLGALYNTHHGLTNAVVMPYVLEYNRAAIDERLTRLAAFLRLPNPSFKAVLDWIIGLRKEIGIPHTLREIGVDDKQVDKVAEMAAADPSAGGNPVQVGAKELRVIFVNGLEGRLAA